MRPRSSVLAGTLPLVLLASSTVVLMGTALKAPVPSGQAEPQKAQIEETLGRLPLSFIENRGQMDPRVSYYVQGSTTSVYFTSGGITFSLSGGEPSEASSPELPGERTLPAGWARSALEAPAAERYTLKLDFVGANPVTPVGTERAPGVVSYFTGPQENWHTGLPTFSSITYPELWPGIDLVYEGTGSELKYTFHVDPGADPNQIRLAYRGATGLELNGSGELEVHTPGTVLTEKAPYSYQDSGGRREVRSSYALDRRTGTYGFDLGDYDPTRALVIDPVVVVYAGYIGGVDSDSGYAVAVDGAGNAYVTGSTFSHEDSFPVSVGPDLTYNGVADAFVAKLNASGQTLAYAGYIGGADSDFSKAVAVDGAGNAYVTGTTSSDEVSFPVSVGPDLTYNGNADAFVAKVEASGETLTYAGYIGGARRDLGSGVVVDGAGNAYVTGTTSSRQRSFPVAVGPDLTYNGGFDDAFVAKVDASGETLGYAGYVGGALGDSGSGVVVDGAGDAFVTGQTSSDEDTFPVVVGPDLIYNGGSDAFVAKVEASGETLAYAGYIGGRSGDVGFGVAVDEAGNAHVTGGTDSDEDSFPVVVGPDLTYNGNGDAFIVKVEASGETLAYAGYIGGRSGDVGFGVAVDEAGNAHVTGGTDSDEDSFPVVVGPDLTYKGNGDAFIVKVAASGEALVYAGYIGGTDSDVGFGVAVDGAGNAYVTGNTYSNEDSFPVQVGPDLTFNGESDAFMAKISSDEEPAPVCTITGTSGHDAIEGTGGDDVICAKAGNDTVSARGGEDTVLGGTGHDTLVGGRGSDVLRGGHGNDVLRTSDGIEGNDEAWGGPGDDVCVIDEGDETFGCDELQVRPLPDPS